MIEFYTCLCFHISNKLIISLKNMIMYQIFAESYDWSVWVSEI